MMLLLLVSLAASAPLGTLAVLGYTEEYLVTGSIEEVEMTAYGASICFFTYISGAFASLDESCEITTTNGFWLLRYAKGRGDAEIGCSARCAYLTEGGMFSTVNVTDEFIATGQQTSSLMVRTTDGVCYMSEVGGALGGGRDSCQITTNRSPTPPDNWLLSYSAAAGTGSGHTCRSRCFCLERLCQAELEAAGAPRRAQLGYLNRGRKPQMAAIAALSQPSFGLAPSFNITSEYIVSRTEREKVMDPEGSHFCYLVYISGDFNSSQKCSIFVSNSYWVLNYDEGNRTSYLQCRARCVSRDIIEPSA